MKTNLIIVFQDHLYKSVTTVGIRPQQGLNEFFSKYPNHVWRQFGKILTYGS